MKPLSRKRIRVWLAPLRTAIKDMLRDEADSINGYCVTDVFGAYARTDECIQGFIGVMRRVFSDLDVTPIARVQKLLTYGVPMTWEHTKPKIGW